MDDTRAKPWMALLPTAPTTSRASFHRLQPTLQANLQCEERHPNGVKTSSGENKISELPVTQMNVKAFAKEFIQFINKHNIVTTAIGVIIADSVRDLIKSIVGDLIKPTMDNGLDKAMEKTGIEDSEYKNGIVHIKIGDFVIHLMEFLMIAFVVVLFTKLINRFF